MTYVIGIDCGTTNIKAVLFDETGAEILVTSRENRPIYSGTSSAEMNMNLIWDKTAHCIKDLVESGPAKKEEIMAVGITGQGEGLWLIDRNGEPVQNAILWCDGRATEEVSYFKRSDIGQIIHTITGTPPLEGTQLMLLKWMQNNRAETLDRAAACFFCKDWIRFRLSGQIACDWTDSGTSLLHLDQGTIAVNILQAMGLKKYLPILPVPISSDTLCACVCEQAAAQTGLCIGTPVITGGLDVSVSALGIGAIKEHDCCVILGTTCATEVVYRKKGCEFGEAGSRYEKHPLTDLYISLQPTMNGTPNLDWAMKEIIGTEDFSVARQLAASEPAGSRGVIYLPYISTSGERAPFHHPYASAGFFGINVQTSRATLIRAVYEGISFSIRDCLGNIDGRGTIYLAGGGAKDTVWAQMISDIMGMPVKIPDTKELGAKGIALMALVRTGVFGSYKAAVTASCKFKAEYTPDPQKKERYDRVFGLFREIRIAHMPLWNRRRELLEYLRQTDCP